MEMSKMRFEADKDMEKKQETATARIHNQTVNPKARMTEHKKMVELTKATYDLLSSQIIKVEAIVNVNRPKHKIAISFDQVIQLANIFKGVNEQLEDIQIQAGV
jgi:hypothetical protein